MNQKIHPTPDTGRTYLARLICVLTLGTIASSQSQTYTTDADFDMGVFFQVNHLAPNNDQLQLDEAEAFEVLSVACGGLNSLVRINTATGEILGEYASMPAGMDGDPSRATSVSNGDVWVGHRLEDGEKGSVFGSVAKFGLVYGGTRVDADGTPNPNGQYLQGPFACNTCLDRDGDGLIRTSRGLGDLLAWPDVTDGLGGPNGLVEDALDECTLIFQRTGPERIRHLALDASANLWAGGYPTFPTSFDEIDGATGAILSNTPAVPPGCGGYAGLFDSSGVMWSTSELEGALYRLDVASGNPAVCITVQNNVRGVAEAPDGFIWTAGSNQVARVSPDGTQVQLFSPPGASQLHGILVDPVSSEVWVASSGTNEVFRLDAAANLIARVPAGTQPRGLSMDNVGKVWVANQGSDDVMRIDPATNAVDLTVLLRPGSLPYNPSDMTGTRVVDPSPVSGSWTVVTDGGQSGTNWTDVSWTDSIPRGAQLLVFVRSAETVGDLQLQSFVQTLNGGGITQTGRFLEVQVVFERLSPSRLSPTLFDLSVLGENEDGPDCFMPNRRQAASLLVFPEFDNLSGNATLLTLTNTDADMDGSLAVELVYIDGETCAEFNRTEYLTANDTLTLITSVHNPDQERGYVYAFAKDAQSGEPIVANSLIGEVFVISGMGGCMGCDGSPDSGRNGSGNSNGIEYGINAIGFKAVGSAGALTDVDQDGLRDLDGIEYEQAPDQILIPRFFGQHQSEPSGALVEDWLVLVSLTGGAQFDTTLDFLVYNDNEEAFSAEHAFHCWDKRSLSSISNVFDSSFLTDHTNHDPGEVLGANWIEVGWMRIDGAEASSSKTSIADPAFLAVLIHYQAGRGASDVPFELCTQPGGALLARDLTGGN